MGAIVAIAVKDLRLLCRDKAAAFFTFGFPLILAVFFGIVFGGAGGGGSGKLRLVAVNEDGGPASVAFVKDLAADEALDVRTDISTTTGLETPYTREQGTEAVRKGRAVACVIVPKGFEEASIFSGEGIKIEALVDPSRNAEAGLLTGKLNQIAFQQMSRTFNDPNVMKKSLDQARASLGQSTGVSEAQRGVLGSLFNSLDELSSSGLTMGGGPAGSVDGEGSAPASGGGWSPVNVSITELKADDKPGPKNSFEISFPQGVVWGLMGCVVGFGASMASERTRGTLLRLSVAPVGRHQVLLGKALGCFIACIMVQVLLIVMGLIPMIGVKVRDPGMMAVAVLANAFGFTGVMMILSGFSRTEEAASGMGRAVIIMLAMIGGGTIPLMFMPAFMETVSSFSPFKWAIMTTEGALWRQFTVGDMLLPVGVLVGIGVLGFVIGTVSLRRAEAV